MTATATMNPADMLDRTKNAVQATDVGVRADLLRPVAATLGNETLAEYVAKLDAYKAAKDTGDSANARGLGSALSPKSKSGQRYIQLLANVVNLLEGMAAPPAGTDPTPRARKTKDGTSEASGERKKRVAKKHGLCLCGCGREVGNLFAMGHDMKVKGMLRRVQRGEFPQTQLPEGVRSMLADLCTRWGYNHEVSEDGRTVVLLPEPEAPKPPKAKKAEAEGSTEQV